MKTFLLAAGLGTRLRPLTDRTPKCLLPVRGAPMLEIWLRHLARCGVDEVLVNTHHLHEQVEEFARKWSAPPRLLLGYEPTLLGSAGTLRANRDFVKNEDVFLVCYADNLTEYNVSLLVRHLQSRRAESPLGVMALHRTDEPRRCGIAEMDPDGWIPRFEEKPAAPRGNLANAGLYAFAAAALDRLPPHSPADIAHDFIPRLLPKLLGLEIQAPLVDIGSPEAYRRAQSQ